MSETETEERQQRDRKPRNRGTADVRKHADRKRRAKESIEELANLLDEMRGRSTDPVEDLVDIVRRDADKMADVIASAAGRLPPVAFVVDRLFGAGGPLSIVQGFGPFLRALLRKAREVREQQAEAYAAEQDRLVSLGLIPDPREQADLLVE